jgi:uncharacterized protein
MESCLYRGWVGHARLAPVSNQFRYKLFYVFLDLSELDTVFANRWLWSVESPNWAVFRRSDHLKPDSGALDSAVRDVVEAQLGWRPAGPVRILTHLRYLGYCFNPISVYYCYDSDGRILQAIVPEVHNTPWGEEYLRALDASGSRREDGWHVYDLEKEFHVSPFMPMDIDYQWRFKEPSDSLAIRMENRRNGELLFRAELEMDRFEMTSANMSAMLLKWPVMTAKVIAAIYWQALKIAAKGVSFCPHPAENRIRKGRYHP